MTTSWRERLINSRKGLDRYRQQLEEIPTVVGMRGRIGENLYISPMKSFGMLETQSLRIGLEGLEVIGHFQNTLCDRSLWLGYQTQEPVIVDDLACPYTRFSQREEPCLALPKCEFFDGRRVYYDVNGVGNVVCNIEDFNPHKGPTHRIRFGSKHPQVIYGVKACRQMRDFVRLLVGVCGRGDVAPQNIEVFCRHPHVPRTVDATYSRFDNVRTAGVDAAYCLVLSQGDIEDMDFALIDAEMDPIGIEPFRPNIVLEGLPPAALDVADEMLIKNITGECIRMYLNALCDRCPVTTVYPSLGIKRPDKQPLQWLAENRPASPGAKDATMGVYASFHPEDIGKVILAGASFEILSEKK